MKQAVVAMIFLIGCGLVFADNQGRISSWFYVVQDDPLDDQSLIKLGSPAIGGQGRLVVFCEGLFVKQIAVDWQSYIGFEADTLKFRFDDVPAVLDDAITSRNGQAVLFKNFDVFAGMLKHGRLHIRAQSGERMSTKTLTFDLEGFKEAVEKSAPDCFMTR